MTVTGTKDRVVLCHPLGRTALAVWMVLGLAVTLPAAVSVTGDGGAGPGARAGLTVVVCVSLLLGLVGWWPAVVLTDEVLVLRNPLHVVTIPWPAVEEVTMGWVLRVRADGVEHCAWGLPGPRRLREMRDVDYTGAVMQRYSASAVDRAARQGSALLGVGDTALVSQRWAARAALAVPGVVQVRVSLAAWVSSVALMVALVFAVLR